MVPVPQKILIRKHEITSKFLNLLDQHIEDILQGKINYVFKIKDFAEYLSIHPTHFSNTVKLVTKRSPGDLLEERLVGEAEKMLSETAMSVAEISDRLMFRDSFASTNFFKRGSGKTPLAYRNQYSGSAMLTLK
jgi:AraC family transcriptional regulator of adaptative response / methylphosphotriester-DNA alkyltransferase methyltransferase